MIPCAKEKEIDRLVEDVNSLRLENANAKGRFDEYTNQIGKTLEALTNTIEGLRTDLGMISNKVTEAITKSDFSLYKDENGVSVSIDPKKSFWDTEAGKCTPKWVVIGIIGIVAIITLSLVGTNWIEFVQTNGYLFKK